MQRLPALQRGGGPFLGGERMSEHTPLPWVQEGHFVRPTTPTLGSLFVAETHFREDPEETNANAEFIVRACNAHPALVAAARKKVCAWEQCGDCRELRDALRAAEGRQ